MGVGVPRGRARLAPSAAAARAAGGPHPAGLAPGSCGSGLAARVLPDPSLTSPRRAEGSGESQVQAAKLTSEVGKRNFIKQPPGRGLRGAGPTGAPPGQAGPRAQAGRAGLARGSGQGPGARGAAGSADGGPGAGAGAGLGAADAGAGRGAGRNPGWRGAGSQLGARGWSGGSGQGAGCGVG